MKDDRLYLIHVRECIADIQSYLTGGRNTFFASKLIQDAVIRKLQILAQSALNLSDALRDAHPEVEWHKIRGFRNIVVHDYLELDLTVVWGIVENNLLPLKQAVEAMIQQLDSDQNKAE